MDGYAQNLKGTAQFILDQWKWYHALGVSSDQYTEMIRTGRRYAYNQILRHITGKQYSDEQQEIIDIM